MIDEYYNYCFGDLEYRSLKFETTCLPCFQFQSVAVINYTEKEVPWTRIIEHNHFEPSSTHWTLVTKEYPIKYTKGQEAYYPINTARNNELYLKYKEKADQEGIIFCGRLGAYQYLDMDKAIEKAFELLEILKKS
jgi:UDP-galactopyranose mutase